MESTYSCGDSDEDDNVQLVVTDDEDEVLAVAGQDEAFGKKNGDVVLTVRTNGEPEK
jgi:hypothetical protein